MTPVTRPRSLLRERDVALVWSAGLMTWIGNYMMFVAMPSLIYGRTGSTTATALAVVGGVLPPVVLGQVAGVVADRVDRRRLLVGTNLALTPLALGYLVLLDGPWWHLALMALAVSSVGQLAGPAEHALLPELVESERLGEAAGLNALNNNLARLIGPAGGGLIFAAVGPHAVITVQAGCFLGAAVLFALVSRRRPHTVPPTAGEKVLTAWLSGLQVVRHSPRLRCVLLVIGIVMLGEGFLGALLIPLVHDVVGGGADTVGWILSAQAIGGVAGAWWASRVADRSDPLRLIGVAAVVSCALLLVIFNYGLIWPVVWPAVLLTGIAGAPFAVFGAAQTQALQQWSPASSRGRAFALSAGVMGLAQLVSTPVAGLLADGAGVLVINVDAAAYGIAGCIALWASRRTASR